MQTTVTHSINHNLKQEQRRYYRVERRFSSRRQLKEFVRDLLRAHCVDTPYSSFTGAHGK